LALWGLLAGVSIPALWAATRDPLD
jgi:hypothetical protein